MNDQGGKIDDVNEGQLAKRAQLKYERRGTLKHIDGGSCIWKTKQKISSIRIISQSVSNLSLIKWIKMSIKVIAGLNKGISTLYIKFIM